MGSRTTKHKNKIREHKKGKNTKKSKVESEDEHQVFWEKINASFTLGKILPSEDDAQIGKCIEFYWEYTDRGKNKSQNLPLCPKKTKRRRFGTNVKCKAKDS